MAMELGANSMVSRGEDDDDIITSLPPGYRFHPTDDEIITHYLTKKVINCSFVASAIAEIDLNKCEPWDLPTDSFDFIHPLDTIKTKLQTKGASEIYCDTIDAIVKTFQSNGILEFYSGVSAVIVGSTASSAVYFVTCEFGKSILSKLLQYPPVLIPPTAGAMDNIVSSAIMVPKELITQRMQAGAKGRSWGVLLKTLGKDGILGLYEGYSATLLRNLPAAALSYSSFEYPKAAVLSKSKLAHLEPYQSVCCGALAGAI